MNNFEGNTIVMFAIEMKKKLDKNEHKGGWQNCDNEYLLKRLKEEVDEVETAIKYNKSLKYIMSECADVANFAMMIADNYEEVKEQR